MSPDSEIPEFPSGEDESDEDGAIVEVRLAVDGVDLFEPNSSRIVTFLTVMGEPTNPLVSRLYKPSYSPSCYTLDSYTLDSTPRDPDDHGQDASSKVRGSLSPASSVESYDAGTHVHPDNEEELSYRLVRQVRQGAFGSRMAGSVAKGQSEGALVAGKMIARAGEQNDGGAARIVVPRGERVCFMREIGVLHFARITCSCSNMFAGGELFDIVNSDEQHAQLSESLLGGNLSAQSSGCTTRAIRSSTQHRRRRASTPLILPRIIRCPLSTHFAQHAPPHKTTARAYAGHVRRTRNGRIITGVVLFALVTRALPFDPPLMLDAPPADIDAERARRRWVLRVVRGEWTWPAPAVDEQAQGEPRGVQLMRLATVREVVARLLVSDPRRPARVGVLWDELWMHGEAMMP
ncbi:hypothetical protein V8E53_000822 [Lactarius tabidus]